ncbi:hypothetical protein LguiA_018155 [Lonicera macranthoides]
MGICPHPSLSRLKPTVAGVNSNVSVMVSPDRVSSNQQSGEFSFCNSNSSVDSLESVTINLISSLPSNESCNGGQSVNNQDCNSLVKLGGDSGLPNANFVSPNKPPMGKTCRRVEDIRTNSTCSNLDFNCNSLGGDSGLPREMPRKAVSANSARRLPTHSAINGVTNFDRRNDQNENKHKVHY